MNRIYCRRPLFSLVFAILLFKGSESKRGDASSGSRGRRSSSSTPWGGGRSYGSQAPSYSLPERGWIDRYYGNTIEVMRTHTYYRGGEYGRGFVFRSGANSTVTQESRLSEIPTVTNIMIRDALFPGDPKAPSRQIFDYTARAPEEEDWEISSGKVQRMSITYADVGVVIIRQERRPVVISSIPYFWGDDNLPLFGNHDADCVNLTAVNDASNFTICNVSTLIRCQNHLWEVLMVGKKPLRGLSDLSNYFAVPSMVDVHVAVKTADGADITSVNMLLAVGFFVSSILISVCCYKVISCAFRSQDTQQQQSIAERQSLTADYPRQQRARPAVGNYGWNVKPIGSPCTRTQ